MDDKPKPPAAGTGDSDHPTRSGTSEHSQAPIEGSLRNLNQLRLALDPANRFDPQIRNWMRILLPEVPEAEHSSSETHSQISETSNDKTHHEEFPFVETLPENEVTPDLLRPRWAEHSLVFREIFARINQSGSVLMNVSLQNIIFNEIFGKGSALVDDEDKPLTNYQNVLQARYAKLNNRFGFCQRVFDEQTDYSYQCFDCFGEGEESRKIICEYCFDKGNHKGHQTTRCNSGGVCDCGTFNHQESPLGNCSMHNGLLPPNEVLSEKDIKLLSTTIQSVCFAFLSHIEETRTVKQQLAVEALFTKEFIQPLNKIITSYSSMIPIVAELFMKPLRDLAVDHNLPIQFLHGHSEITHIFYEHSAKEPRSDCSCSILELCLRFTHKFSLGKQTQIRDLLLSFSAYRPFKEYLAVCWVRFYPRLVRSKIYFSILQSEVDDDDPSHSPLCELRNEILQDSKILEHIVKSIDPIVIFQHLRCISQPKIDDPNEVLLPIGPCWSVYSINDMVIMSKVSKIPCLMRDIHKEFAATMYSVLFAIFQKIERQTIALMDKQKFLETDEMQVSLMKYQYSCVDLVHEQFASMIGAQRRDLCIADMKILVGLVTRSWQDKRDLPGTMKSIEGTAHRILTVMFTGMLFLQSVGQDDLRIINLARKDFSALNLEIFEDNQRGKSFWHGMLNSVLNTISMVHFVKKFGCTPFQATKEEISERYDGLEFDLYDITSLQFAIAGVDQFCFGVLLHVYFNFAAAIGPNLSPPIPDSWENYSVLMANRGKEFLPLTRGEESKLPNLITEFFNLLIAVFSEDLAVVAVLSEYSVVRNVPVKKGIKNQPNKFYQPSIRREFLNSMLAQNPIKCEDFTKFAMVGLNHDDLLKESLVEELCDVNFEDRVISLKPKVLEQALKDLDINSLNFREANKEQLNGWLNRVDKKYHDKLSIKTQIECELVRMAREKLALQAPKDIVGLIKAVVAFSPFWKKIQGPLSSILRFVLVYADCLQAYHPDPKIPLGELMNELIPYLDGEVKASPVYKLFQTKLARIRKKFAEDQPGVVRTISATMNMEDMNVELIEENTQEKVAQLFSEVKNKIFAKMKAKQAQFFSNLDETTTKYVQEFKTTLHSDALTCSITKEQLTNSETYFIFAHMTESNLLRQATINNLKSLQQQMYLDAQIEVGLKQHQLSLSSVNPYTIEEVLIQSCGHLLKSENEAIIGDPNAGYLDNEYACPMCKNASNIVLPVYSQEIVSLLTDDSRLFEPKLSQYYSLSDCTKFSADNQVNWTLEEKLGSKLKEIAEAVTAGLRRRFLVNLSAREEYLDQLSISSNDYQTRETDQFATKAPEVTIISSMLRYSEITGFSSAIQSSPKLMNSIYFSFRIMILTQQQQQTILWERFNIVLQSLANPGLLSDLRKSQSELLALASLLPISVDWRNHLFKQAIEFGLDSIIVLFLADQDIQDSKLTWELIRYDPKFAHIINPILRLLRMATFMKYAFSFQSHTNSKKLMERIIQYNLQGDEKELEYHLTYLDVSPPDLSKSHSNSQHVLLSNTSMLPVKPAAESSVVFKLLNQETLNFSFFNCGRTLRQALEIFFHNCCQRCKRRTEKASICLLCGDLICAMECGFKGNDTDFAETHKQGQLTQHSMIVHKGKSVYLNCESLYFLFYDDTRKIIFDSMYLNKFGRIAETDKMKEFPKKPESYFLNSKKFQEIYDLILTQHGLEYIMRKSFTEDLDPRGNEL